MIQIRRPLLRPAVVTVAAFEAIWDFVNGVRELLTLGIQCGELRAVAHNKKTVVYQIVSEKEADLKLGKISVNSPIGRGLLGKHVGEVAEVSAPSGTFKFRVESISI